MIAYIDPSAMTYLIQIIAGVAIAIGAAITIFYRKAKKKVSNKLGIDENRNKEVESDEIVVKAKDEKIEKVEEEKPLVEKKSSAKKASTKNSTSKSSTKKSVDKKTKPATKKVTKKTNK